MKIPSMLISIFMLLMLPITMLGNAVSSDTLINIEIYYIQIYNFEQLQYIYEQEMREAHNFDYVTVCDISEFPIIVSANKGEEDPFDFKRIFNYYEETDTIILSPFYFKMKNDRKAEIVDDTLQSILCYSPLYIQQNDTGESFWQAKTEINAYKILFVKGKARRLINSLDCPWSLPFDYKCDKPIYYICEIESVDPYAALKWLKTYVPYVNE